MGEGNENLVYPCPSDFKSFLHAVKSYDMEPSDFTFHRKEGVLRIFIALKNPSPRPGFNPRALGSVASTLTTTPPRRLWLRVAPWSPTAVSKLDRKPSASAVVSDRCDAES
jgi:hypothetical protein